MIKIISFENIKKSYGDLDVIEDISLEVEAGKIYCILGASGCGKSTFLDIASGLIEKDGGNIKTDLEIPGRDLGYMVQADSLLPWRTVRGNIEIAFELLRAKKVKSKIDKIIKDVKLTKFADYFPSELSGGQKQRIALARTLVYEPKLVLLDEPLGSLDVIVRKELAKVIKDYIKEKNASAIVITHSVEEAIYLADELFVLTNRPSKIYKKFSIKDDMRDSAYGFVNEALESAIRIGEIRDEK